ncbi:hypothetical protein J2S80_000036 [Pseudoxanthomonas mexicana]|nr:hypothetical protein [Pseudoxanthomonas mexicana]
MRRPRADSMIEMDQLERRFDHLGHGAVVTDFSAIVRECDRVVALLPAADRSWARERIEQLRARLHRRKPESGGDQAHGAALDPNEHVAPGKDRRLP